MIKKYLNNKLRVWNNKFCVGLSLVLAENKSLEIEFIYNPQFHSYFGFDFCWTRRQDHAGFRLAFEIVGAALDINITDHRHWNYDKDRWYKPGEEALEQLAEEAHKLGITDDEPPE